MSKLKVGMKVLILADDCTGHHIGRAKGLKGTISKILENGNGWPYIKIHGIEHEACYRTEQFRVLNEPKSEIDYLDCFRENFKEG